jgi:hypothetical protein
LLRLRLLMVVALALLLPAAGSAATPNASFQVSLTPATQYDATHAVAPLGSGFVGVSMEYCDLLPGIVESATTAGGPPLASPVLTALIAGLAPGQRPVLRLGGDSTDHGYWNASALPARSPRHCPFRRYALGPGMVSAIDELAHSLDAKLILGLNLRAHDASLAATEAGQLVRTLGQPARALDPGFGAFDSASQSSLIDAFEIGNEPDLYPLYSSTGGFDRYLKDFSAWAVTARATAGTAAVVAGPSLGRVGLPWITGPNAANWQRFIAAQAAPRLLTFHFYPLLKHACPGVMCPSIANLLSDGASAGLAQQVAPFVAAAPATARVRVDEMNSVTGEGAPGVSNTFASALWALDTLFQFDAAGVTGVNVQTIPGASYALFDPLANGFWSVRPEYYGLKLFAQASPPGSQLLSVSGAVPGVKLWATRASNGRIRIVLINKVPAPRRVVLAGAATGGQAFTIERLLAPSNADARGCRPPYAHTGLCATSGIQLGGRSFGPLVRGRARGDMTPTGLLPPQLQSVIQGCTQALRGLSCALPGPDSVISVNMPAGSAAMLTSL